MKDFKNWLEDNSLNSDFPELWADRGSETPASDEVKRTNLQPQVDAQEIQTKAKTEQDKILAIDADIERMSTNLPEGDEDNQKLNRFKKLWDKMKEKWEKIKMSDEMPAEDKPEGLGSNTGNQDFLKQMQQHPNMSPINATQGPSLNYPMNV